MIGWRFLSHRADIRMEVRAKNLPDLFRFSLQGMAEIIKPGKVDKKMLTEIHRLNIEAADLTALLIDFLSEVLTVSHLQQAVFCQVDFIRLEPTRLAAKIYGAKVDGFDEDIKAVTYHQAEVKQDKQGIYHTVIVFDI